MSFENHFIVFKLLLFLEQNQMSILFPFEAKASFLSIPSYCNVSLHPSFSPIPSLLAPSFPFSPFPSFLSPPLKKYHMFYLSEIFFDFFWCITWGFLVC